MDFAGELQAFIDAVAVDGVAPFNEATLLNLDERAVYALRAAEQDAAPGSDERGELLGLALTRPLDDGTFEAELAVHPAHRRQGLGRRLAERVLAAGPATFWAHGNLAGAQALAAALGLHATRSLYLLARPLGAEDAAPAQSAPVDASQQLAATPASSASTSAATPAPGLRIRTFDPDADAAAWVALNARVFAAHPEQGALTLEDLRERMAQPWFTPKNFFVLTDAEGALLGYNWLKVTPAQAEIYVIGVAPEAAGQGAGTALMRVGMARLRELGASEVVLYVDGDNEAAMHLYRRLGFIERSVDVQYR